MLTESRCCNRLQPVAKIISLDNLGLTVKVTAVICGGCQTPNLALSCHAILKRPKREVFVPGIFLGIFCRISVFPALRLRPEHSQRSGNELWVYRSERRAIEFLSLRAPQRRRVFQQRQEQQRRVR